MSSSAPESNSGAGCLYVVATPIGNLGELCPRAVDVLATVDIVACEDTRVTAKLLRHAGTGHKELVSYRDENEHKLAGELAERIANGEQIALVADAGTPTLSDPGFRLVRECRRLGLTVRAVSGPSAVAAALSISGLPTDAFLFRGFLPPKSAARRRFLEEYQAFPHTLVLYESVHRVGKLVDEMLEILGGQRIICIARELTKLHETVLTGTLADVAERFREGTTKGEFVILIAPETYEL